jgi:hypothetical protein
LILSFIKQYNNRGNRCTRESFAYYFMFVFLV